MAEESTGALSHAPTLRFDDVSFAFDGDPVLRRLRTELPGGEITVLMGRSGGGKTTLIRQLVGLLRPDSGRIMIGDQCVNDLGKAPLSALRRSVGVLIGGSTLFDTSVFGSQSVYDNLAYPLRARDEEETTIHALVDHWLRTLDLRNVHDRLPETLPAHARRRVALGRALVTDRPVVVLDDIDLGLDSITRERVVGAIRAYQLRTGATMLVTTHDIELAKAFESRLAVLAGGRIVANGPAGELLHGVEDAEEFDDRFRGFDPLGPGGGSGPADGGRTITYDPRMLAIAVVAALLAVTVALVVQLNGIGP